MKKTKVLLVADGGVTKELMQKMYDLEQYGAEITLVEDKDMDSFGVITHRMGVIEKQGIEAAPICGALLENCADKEIIAVHVASVNKEILAACKELKAVAVLRGGYENIDVEACNAQGVQVVNAPWRSADAVADFTVGMMIAENKNIARSHSKLMQGEWCKTYVNNSYIHNMNVCTVGLIGFGYIGSRVAKRLQGFESKVIVHDPFGNDQAIRDAGYEPVGIDELLQKSDFVSVHLRHSDATDKWFKAEHFKKMKSTAYFINTARPGIVDTQALIDALKSKSIGGAAIDVFDEEPLSPDSELLKLDNITVVPHLAGSCCDTMRVSVEICYEDLERYLKGEPMLNLCK